MDAIIAVAFVRSAAIGSRSRWPLGHVTSSVSLTTCVSPAAKPTASTAKFSTRVQRYLSTEITVYSITVPMIRKKSINISRTARASVNFRKLRPCMAPARRARVGFRKVPPSRTLELSAFDEYCRFDNSAFFMRIKRGSLYTHKESRSIKTAIFIES